MQINKSIWVCRGSSEIFPLPFKTTVYYCNDSKSLLILLTSFVLTFFCGLAWRNKHRAISKLLTVTQILKKNRNSLCRSVLWKGNIISSACFTIIFADIAGGIYTSMEICYWCSGACSWLKPDYAANQIPVSGKGSFYSPLCSLVIAAPWQILIIERASLLYCKSYTAVFLAAYHPAKGNTGT